MTFTWTALGGSFPHCLSVEPQSPEYRGSTQGQLLPSVTIHNSHISQQWNFISSYLQINDPCLLIIREIAGLGSCLQWIFWISISQIHLIRRHKVGKYLVKCCFMKILNLSFRSDSDVHFFCQVCLACSKKRHHIVSRCLARFRTCSTKWWRAHWSL